MRQIFGDGTFINMTVDLVTSRHYASLLPGDPAPWFRQRCTSNDDFVFSSVAGRYIVMCFLGSAGHPMAHRALAAVMANRPHFDDLRASCFGISLDPGDEAEGRLREVLPGFRVFWDFDAKICELYGVVASGRPAGASIELRPAWVVLDPTLRVMTVIPFAADGSDGVALGRFLDALPPPSRFCGFEVQAPVLVLPQVFEPDFCRSLIELYEKEGGEESGFMREIDGKTVRVNDNRHKRRRDHTIVDDALIRQTQARVLRRIVPEIRKVHQFMVTRMERYIVACYAAEDEAHFAPHRDNTTKGTAHRRFAVSINLNEDFDGGEVSFPEYGPRGFKAPPGGAVVFSCSLLHAVSQVTRGRRYAFLPFLYDDAAAKQREANNPFLAEGLGVYKP